jgi:hypothetical protein
MSDIMEIIDAVKAAVREEKPEEDVFRLLEPHFGDSPERDTEWVESLVAVPHRATALFLQRLLERTESKTVRKAIKRSLYRLKGKGISVDAISAEKGASILRPLQAEPPKGFGSNFDYLGHRLLLLVLPHATKSWMVMQGVLDEGEELVDFQTEEMAGKRFLIFFEDLKSRNPFPFVEIEAPYVGSLFTRGHQMRSKLGKSPLQSYLRVKSEIERIKKDYEKPPVYSLLKADAVTAHALVVSKTGDLLKADVCKEWQIGEELIRPYAEEVLEAEESKIVLNPIQKEARVGEIYQKAITDLFSGERNHRVQRRLEETAYYFLKIGKEEEATTALATAIELDKPMNPFQPNPFLLQLVIKSILTLLLEEKEKKAAEPSLIVKP